MNDGSGFCGSFFRGSGAFLLLTDLVEAECQSGDRGQEGAENLGDESVLAGKLAEALKLLDRQDGAFNEAALDFQNVLVLLGKLADDTSRGNGVTRGGGCLLYTSPSPRDS